MNGQPIVTEYKGKMYSLKELSEIIGIRYVVMYRRYCNGDRGDRLCRSCYEKVCKICGKEFIAKASNTKCCSDECKKENSKMNKKLCDERKKLQPKKKKEKKLTVTELAVKAKEAGMSYGQYTAMLHMQGRKV